MPCMYRFIDPEDTMKKVKQCLIEEGKSVDDTELKIERKVGIQDFSQENGTLPSSTDTATSIGVGLRKQDIVNGDKEDSHPWIRMEDIMLTLADKKTIERGEILLDKHSTWHKRC